MKPAGLFKGDGILDLRPFNEFKQAHVQESTSMPWQELPERLNELPAAPAQLFLVGDEQAIEEASAFLDYKGYAISGSLLIDSFESLQKWESQLPGLFTSGSQSKRLWKPNELVVQFVETVWSAQRSGPNPGKPTAIDLGCGGGRDAVYLAKSGWQVIGIDHENRVIKRAKQLAQNSGASVKWKCCDLKKEGCLPDSQFDLVMVMRFLNRALFTQIDAMIKPGGFVVFQTFTEGAEAYGSPKNPNFLLKEGELSEVFADYRIITDKIEKLPDGRPVASFIAQKPVNRD
ncbi:methyltransferase domain-containing protein [Thiomicrorhabdus sp. zzn3]|uniref:methyltransferase domain-containing protein n=1 Tax=Thiomicrorhabdus sp. zzn3 TaxID=3039775 RepID=UPI002436BABF|nr:methyltransferase domain-containing protein [Thiomicrorhabdus sp. zzn3]MDG6777891.1 methyltransferase domain-containing protein [Thiomicrorhabdus sp. zzn3]